MARDYSHGSAAMSSTLTDSNKDSRDPWQLAMEQVSEKRDKASFMRLYDHFAPRLNAYLQGLGAPVNQAEELVQEALLTLWRKAHLYQPAKAAVSTWLFRIGRNLYIDSLRRASGIQVSSDEVPEAEDVNQPTADVHADGVRLQQAMNELPVLQAQVVYKSYFETKSHSEIAEDLGIPLGSVKSSLRLAFQKLRASMGEAV
ncbi:sigma-70 family RNA polymerase sigma factor [Pokkaliibacter sp. CJK22405]|uniref:sigma-70 family RNA polymerase sigma factor n=1 Tax=Pokkaliibacter sp. CJK22405 TaxID=3384615 RepID=UPI003984C8B0